MVAISKGEKLASLINVFTVDPKNQDKLVGLLVEATKKTMGNVKGFVSANVHKSLDGRAWPTTGGNNVRLLSLSPDFRYYSLG